MGRAIIASVLVLAGCGLEPQPALTPAQGEAYDRAVSAWESRGVHVPPFVVRFVDAVPYECRRENSETFVPEDATITGCRVGARVWVLWEAHPEPEHRWRTLAHELGHIVRGKPGHLGDGEGIMAASTPRQTEDVTDADVRFVRKLDER